jgi:hypothetical protein
MLKATLLAAALALGFAVPARAASEIQKGGTVRTALPAEVVEVQSPPRNSAGVILGDAIGGAVLGAAVGGGVALYRHETTTPKDWGNWQRDVAIGAGIGLAAGLLFGAVDAANSDRTFVGPVADVRPTGFVPPAATYGARY